MSCRVPLTICCTGAAARAGSEINVVRRGQANGGVRRHRGIGDDRAAEDSRTDG